MILTCNDCDTKFMVDASDIGDKGRRVRCGNCSSVWFVKPPAPGKVAEEKQIAVEQKENLKEAVAQKAAGVEPSLPSVVVTMQVPKWLKAAVVVLVLANAFAFVLLNKNMIGQTSFYELVGQYRTDGVEIANAELVIKDEKGKKKYKIEWSIQNSSDEARDLPARRIKLLDKDLKIITKGTDKTQKNLDAGQTVSLEPNKIPNEDERVKYVVVDIGNPFELSLR